MLTSRDVWIYLYAQTQLAEQPPDLTTFVQHYMLVCRKLGLTPMNATEARNLTDDDLSRISEAIKAVFGDSSETE